MENMVYSQTLPVQKPELEILVQHLNTIIDAFS